MQWKTYNHILWDCWSYIIFSFIHINYIFKQVLKCIFIWTFELCTETEEDTNANKASRTFIILLKINTSHEKKVTFEHWVQNVPTDSNLSGILFLLCFCPGIESFNENPMAWPQCQLIKYLHSSVFPWEFTTSTTHQPLKLPNSGWQQLDCGRGGGRASLHPIPGEILWSTMLE